MTEQIPPSSGRWRGEADVRRQLLQVLADSDVFLPPFKVDSEGRVGLAIDEALGLINDKLSVLTDDVTVTKTTGSPKRLTAPQRPQQSRRQATDLAGIRAAAGSGAAWDFDEGNAAMVYGVGTIDLEEGNA